jgi:Protein of unknown function (DUF3040)
MGGTMPLSEHEQRMLEQIEKALYAEDPKFAQSVRARDPRVHYRRRVILAAVGFLVGVGLLLAGVVIKYIPMGVAGFLVMLTCAMWALTSWRHMNGTAAATAPRRGPAPAPRKRRSREPGQGFMERLEERWRRRQEGDR